MSSPSWVGPSASTPELRPDASGPWVTRRDLRVGGVLVGCLAFAGVLVGFVWLAIAPRAHGFAYLNHTVVPVENESFVASDGRFLLLAKRDDLARPVEPDPQADLVPASPLL